MVCLVSQHHDSGAGWNLLLNFLVFILMNSGGGKSNCIDAMSEVVANFEMFMGLKVKTSSFTMEALLQRLYENGSALIVLHEAGKLAAGQNQYKSGGDDKYQLMEAVDGVPFVIDRKGKQEKGKEEKENESEKVPHPSSKPWP